VRAASLYALGAVLTTCRLDAAKRLLAMLVYHASVQRHPPTSPAGTALIVRIATHIGSQVDTDIMVGDRVGVGTRISSFLHRQALYQPKANYCANSPMCVVCFPSSPRPSLLSLETVVSQSSLRFLVHAHPL
jgi:hypothetical protein